MIWNPNSSRMGWRRALQRLSRALKEEEVESRPVPTRRRRKHRHHDDPPSSSESDDRYLEQQCRKPDPQHYHQQRKDQRQSKVRHCITEVKTQRDRHRNEWEDDDEYYDEIYLYSRPLSSYYSSSAHAASRSGLSRSPAPDERAERSNPWQHWALRIGDTFYEAFKSGNWLEFRSYDDNEAYHYWGWRSEHIEKYLGRTKLRSWQIKRIGSLCTTVLNQSLEVQNVC